MSSNENTNAGMNENANASMNENVNDRMSDNVNENILEVKNLKVYFDLKAKFTDNLMGKEKQQVKAVDDISLTIKKGEILSLVGESGSGKTTTGKAILQLAEATEGEILFEGKQI